MDLLFHSKTFENVHLEWVCCYIIIILLLHIIIRDIQIVHFLVSKCKHHISFIKSPQKLSFRLRATWIWNPGYHPDSWILRHVHLLLFTVGFRSASKPSFHGNIRKYSVYTCLQGYSWYEDVHKQLIPNNTLPRKRAFILNTLCM